MHVLVTEANTRCTQAIGQPGFQARAIRFGLTRQCRRVSRHNIPVMHVLILQTKIRDTQAMESQRVNGPANALDLSGNVGAGVHLKYKTSWDGVSSQTFGACFIVVTSLHVWQHEE